VGNGARVETEPPTLAPPQHSYFLNLLQLAPTADSTLLGENLGEGHLLGRNN